ncbi:hypothetical protein B0H17DRAFT_1147760 [Mycena rosella]|uniref:Uncharacterized protein n=1 Tax=Mycena rosella TaxID=1033263 RepID=A0AAD7CHG5_MYCRO|nr:hypothetical protein B0H17DRAFT_1147760 [Mycena rosella]
MPRLGFPILSWVLCHYIYAASSTKSILNRTASSSQLDLFPPLSLEDPALVIGVFLGRQAQRNLAREFGGRLTTQTLCPTDLTTNFWQRAGCLPAVCMFQSVMIIYPGKWQHPEPPLAYLVMGNGRQTIHLLELQSAQLGGPHKGPVKIQSKRALYHRVEESYSFDGTNCVKRRDTDFPNLMYNYMYSRYTAPAQGPIGGKRQGSGILPKANEERITKHRRGDPKPLTTSNATPPQHRRDTAAARYPLVVHADGRTCRAVVLDGVHAR